MPRITLYGMMQYDETLFDDVVLPDGLDKDILVAEIVSKSGDLFPYYQVPPVLKRNITYWFIRRRYDFEQMYKALTATYNPIENYDRYEIATRNYTNSGKDNTSRTYRNENTSTDTTTLGTQTITDGTGATREGVSAYNSSDYANRSKTDSTRRDTTTNSGSDKNINVANSQSSDDSTVNYGAVRDESEDVHVHGNIGVTTNQQMIEAEEELRIKYDLYSMIATLFEREFILQIY